MEHKMLQNYTDKLFLATDTVASKSLISKWFLYRWSYQDEKHLKGADLFNRKGHASSLTDFVNPRVVGSDS
eukprot:11606482-Ditylum_brightwellii.AAC.1